MDKNKKKMYILFRMFEFYNQKYSKYIVLSFNLYINSFCLYKKKFLDNL